MYSITSAFARYTAFIVLYPIGLAPGESECMISHLCLFLWFTCHFICCFWSLLSCKIFIHHSPWCSVDHVPSSSVCKEEESLCRFLCCFPFQLLWFSQGMSDFLWGCTIIIFTQTRVFGFFLRVSKRWNLVKLWSGNEIYLTGIKYGFSYLKRKLYWGLQLGVVILLFHFLLVI